MENKAKFALYLLTTASVSFFCLSRSPLPAQSQANNPAPAPAPATPNTPTAAPAATPQAPTQNITRPTISGLNPSTNPNARLPIINKQRTDPFLSFNIPVKVKSIEDPTQNAAGVKPPTPPSKPLNEPPKKPEPDLAKQVVISGVIYINDKPQLIVKAPNEASSRYVEPGQYVSNGKVLIKKVVTSPEGVPTVTLEQSGMQVVKTVGQVN